MDSYSICYRFESYFHQFTECSAVGSVFVLGTKGHAFESHHSDIKFYKTMKQLHLILCILILISSLLVVLSTNPVESVLFLILTFCNASTMLFFFNLEFFGLIFLIIYVGAIAVLFLFVVMMLNIKLHSSIFGSLNRKNILLMSSCFLLAYIFVTNIYLLSSASLPALFEFKTDIGFMDYTLSDGIISFDTFYNIDVFGQVFYNYYLVYLPLAGFILLIALVGVIVLTLEFNKPKKTQLGSKQLSRTDSFLSFFYHVK